MITGVLLFVPLMVAGTLSIALLFLDANRRWKAVCLVVVAACVVMRFACPEQVPFLVPFLLESALSLALSLWLKTEQYF